MDATIEMLAMQECEELRDVTDADMHEEFAPVMEQMNQAQASSLLGRDITADDDRLD